MTTPEHTLVGIHAAFACGLERRFGWTVIVLAAVASNLPDWDGLPMLVDMSRFESGHRVWGHNVLWIVTSSMVLGVLQYRFHLIKAIAQRCSKYLPQGSDITGDSPHIPLYVLVAICLVAQAIHLPCDMVLSGGSGLSDWYIRPLWPFSDVGFVFPMIPWGDVGPTVILMLGAIMLAKKPDRLVQLSVGTLVILVVYLVLRGASRGVLSF